VRLRDGHACDDAIMMAAHRKHGHTEPCGGRRRRAGRLRHRTDAVLVSLVRDREISEGRKKAGSGGRLKCTPPLSTPSPSHPKPC
jgi:hypothetical protein